MRTLRTVAELRRELAAARSNGCTIGLVPTMGALHRGHLSLIERAREQCDTVIVSLFVNPSQFDERDDLERYPRSEQADAESAAAAGADVLFAPAITEVYPPGFATSVHVSGALSGQLEGAVRGAGHFAGVATVVTKLLCTSQPDVAYFGQKDAQQLAVIRRLVADLNLPVRIEALPIVREPDGLAMSSRNALLTPADRERALALPAALARARELAAGGERSAAAVVAAVRAAMAERGVSAEYVALVDPVSFAPQAELAGEALLLVAARLGSVRLIDNAILPTPARSHGAGGAGEEVLTCNA